MKPAVASWGGIGFDGLPCMKLTLRPLITRLAALAAIGGITSCNSLSDKEDIYITVHAQGEAIDNPRMIFPETIDGQQVIFKLIPEFTNVNIAAIHPFPAQGGDGSGLAMKLDFRGSNALHIVTRNQPGQLMLAKVNGKSVDFVSIDQPVADGMFTIWRGVPDEVIKKLEKKFPHLSESRSAGRGLDMTPTTKGEKRTALQRAKEMLRMKKKKPKEEPAANPGLSSDAAPGDPAIPQGPVTNQIPLEGPAPGLPAVPALPQPNPPFPQQ